MEQILLHLIGDFWIQTDRMATNKKLPGIFGLRQCIIHCITYSLPFLLIGSWLAVLVIFITHFIVDRTKVIDYMIAIKNNTRDPYRPGRKYDISNFGFHPDRPKLITVWLYIACDNIVHLVCNYVALKYL